MALRDRQRHMERDEDLNYGQNLIKKLGYKNPRDKKPAQEPTGTLYDSIFESRVHKSMILAKHIDGTKSHQVTAKLQEENSKRKNQFNDKLIAYSGTLLEQKTRRREDGAMT